MSKYILSIDGEVVTIERIEVTKSEALARRKPTAEQWPKYYEAIYKENAYVKRLSETKYIVVKTDGSESAEWKWKSHIGDNRKMITESEALARVKPAEPIAHPVKSKITLAEARELASKSMAEIEATRCPVDPAAADRIPDNRPAREVIMEICDWLDPARVSGQFPNAALAVARWWLDDNPDPLEAIAQAVERAATPLVTAAVESPDDWVEITDPEHVIRKIDQVNARGNSEKGYCCAVSSIGSKVKNNEYLTVRCRRRDLPVPTASQPKRIPVRMWHNPDSEDGMVFVSDVRVLAEDQEIKFDGSGFYVTEGE